MPIIGHQKTIANLQNLIANDALGHGYIFFGPSMVGKRTIAMALAHFLERGTFEVSTHETLQDIKVIDIAFMRSMDPDVKDSIGINAVREIKNFLWQKPNTSARRTLIIDNAELLTNEAQNALLKITEEPPASSLLILITSDAESILPTIVSRLPKLYFGAVAQEEITQWLTADQKLTKIKTDAIAKQSLGKPGLAWRLLNDEAFQKDIELAEAFLKTTTTDRKDFIKKLIDPDEFSLRSFLDAVIITLAWEKPSKTKAVFWHKALRLYDNVNNFNLNPRLQLESLMK